MGSCDASNILGSMLQNTVHLLSSNEFLAFFNFSHAGNETPEQTGLDQRKNLQTFHYRVHPSGELIFPCDLPSFTLLPISRLLPEVNLASIRLKDIRCADCKTRVGLLRKCSTATKVGSKHMWQNSWRSAGRNRPQIVTDANTLL
jgi:hypothetical protein